MIFRWWRQRRRRKLLAQMPDSNFITLLSTSIRTYADWPQKRQQKAQQDVRVFIAEKNWEGCNGLQVNEQMKVVVAAQAAMMLTGVQDYYFDGVETILLYPSSFRRKSSNGLIVSEKPLIGEAWHRGPIVLSWRDVEIITPGRNVVVHELAHHLDGLDGDISGSPILGTSEQQERWDAVSKAEYTTFRDRLDHDRSTFLDPYGGTNQAEFFAVASEAFFEDPHGLRFHHPRLFFCLTEVYQADPTDW